MEERNEGDNREGGGGKHTSRNEGLAINMARRSMDDLVLATNKYTARAIRSARDSDEEIRGHGALL